MKNVFRPKILDTIKGYSSRQLVSDLVAGLIVAIIALPLSIALAIASGVDPERGLYTAIVAGFVIALLGGSRVNISGPTAAFATIVAGIVFEFGLNGLIIATIMAGIILILMGVLRLGVLIKYIPVTITTGFTSGIAVTIVVGQIKDFLGLTFAEGTHAVETTEKLVAVVKSMATFNPWALLVGAVGLAILIVWPKISKKIPGSLIAVVVGILLVKLMDVIGARTGLDLHVNTIGDLYSISRGFPSFSLPAASDLNMIPELLPSAFTIALLAGIESLLSCVVSDGMIKDKHNSNTELIAQGVGNICSGLFGGIPATGAIARTAANVKNGGRTPISGIVHALVLLLVLLVLMPYAAWIPMPIIVAVLFMVAYNMCEWRHFVKICKTAPLADILVLVATFVLTVVFDLVVAIAVGMVLTVVIFMKQMGDRMQVRRWSQKTDAPDDRRLEIPQGVAVFEIDGPMFFASAEKLGRLDLDEGTRVVILRMRSVPSLDATATGSLLAIAEHCRKNEIALLLAHVNEKPYAVMKRAGLVDVIGEDCFCPHIDDALSRAKELL